MPLYNDEAVVLRTFPLGEADRIVVMLTRNHGKVRAVAKGVRRLKSRFGGRLEPFMRVNMLIAKGKSLDVISQAVSLSTYAASICANYDSYKYANLMVEVIDYIVNDSYQDTSSQYSLLIAALSALSRGVHSPEAIGLSYVMRALCIAGWSPRINSCAVCGSDENLKYFSPALGGITCVADCSAESLRCSDEARCKIRALIQGDWNNLDGSVLDDEVVNCVKCWCEYYLERPIRSMNFSDSF